MTIPTTGTTPTQTSSTTGGAARAAGSVLGKDDFLKLLVGQLKNQDPMQPTDNSQWIAQMAQFSQLEQTTNMATSNEKIVTALGNSQAMALIGHTVSYLDKSGTATRGTVEQVDMAGGSATLTIGGVAGIDAARVTQVK